MTGDLQKLNFKKIYSVFAMNMYIYIYIYIDRCINIYIYIRDINL